MSRIPDSKPKRIEGFAYDEGEELSVRRPRHEAAYEGDDEFSVMSLTPIRRNKKKPVEINPEAKGSPKPTEQSPTAWSVIKRFFGGQ